MEVDEVSRRTKMGGVARIDTSCTTIIESNLVVRLLIPVLLVTVALTVVGEEMAPYDAARRGPESGGFSIRVDRPLSENPTDHRGPLVVSDPNRVKGASGSSREPGGRSVPDSPVTLEGLITGIGFGVGYRGMSIGDLDGDSDLELVATAGPNGYKPNDHWIVFDHDGLEYAKEKTTLPYSEPIYGLRLADMDPGDPGLEIVILLEKRLLIYDGRDLSLISERTVARNNASGFEVANIDSDPSMEAVYCDGDGTHVYDLDSGERQYSLDDIGCFDLAVGEVDGSGGKEVVIANGAEGFVLDAETGVVEWNHPSGFGDMIALGDLDGDSVAEIVTGFSWDGLEVWNGDTQTQSWETEIFNVYDVITSDIDQDGSIEVIYCDKQHGGFHILDGMSGEEELYVKNPGSGFTRIAVGDIDEDGVNDIYISTGYFSSGADYFYVYDTGTETLVWESVDFSGPFYGMTDGDVDGDGDNELVFASYRSQSGYGPGKYYVYDAVTKDFEYLVEDWDGVRDIEVANVDADPQLEVVVATSASHDGRLSCRDGKDRSLQWDRQLEYGTGFGSVEIADLEGDGVLEIVVGEKATSYGVSSEEFAYVFDAEYGYMEWEGPALDLEGKSFITLLRVGDVDGDGIGESLMAQYGRDMIVFDTINDVVEMRTDDLGITAIETANLDADSAEEIIIGTNTGFLAVVDFETGVPTTIGGPFGGAINGLAAIDLTSDGISDFVFVVEGYLHLVEGETMKPLWVSDFLGSSAGRHDSLVVRDLDLDGRIEIWVNMGSNGLAMYEVLPSDG